MLVVGILIGLLIASVIFAAVWWIDGHTTWLKRILG